MPSKVKEKAGIIHMKPLVLGSAAAVSFSPS